MLKCLEIKTERTWRLVARMRGREGSVAQNEVIAQYNRDLERTKTEKCVFEVRCKWGK